MQREGFAGIQSRHDHVSQKRSIEAVAIWCQALQKVMSLPEGLRRVADLVSADLVALARVDHVGSTTDLGVSRTSKSTFAWNVSRECCRTGHAW